MPTAPTEGSTAPRVLQHLLSLWSRLRPTGWLAAFDMDGTLIFGDAGDLVYQNLLTQIPLPLAWDAYVRLLEQRGPITAYRRQMEALSGVPGHLIRSLSRALFPATGPGACPPTPLQSLLHQMAALGATCAMVSSSHQETVLAVRDHLFPEMATRIHALGVRFQGHAHILEPAPIGPGKAKLLQERFPGHHLMLAAGNSEGDLALLSTIHPQGLALWVDSDPFLFEEMSHRHPFPDRFIHWPL